MALSLRFSAQTPEERFFERLAATEKEGKVNE
jgi:hypothetical protein